MSALDVAIELLSRLIKTPSFSREENQTADIIHQHLVDTGSNPYRIKNNVIAKNTYWDDELPILLLNSHHDTVKPAKSYTNDPFSPEIKDGKLFGLGSNDAGGALVSLIQTFNRFCDYDNLPFNLLLIASAEEEISGVNGIALALESFPEIMGGIVGEPTLMEAAVAERGLMVVDGMSKGKSGHAARQEGINAIYKGIEAIEEIKNILFDRKSQYLPDTQAVVTQINAGSQHNVVPDQCTFVIDVRVNELYSNREVFAILEKNCSAELKARSFRLNPSRLPKEHVLFRTIQHLQIPTYGSPTLSDQALMPFPTLKMGPGDSARSHTADEFIFVQEIEEGIHRYQALINELIKTVS
ncbi:M20/M25/M40 family metallo-hydrolase [Membranihabitans maritimus]|uniref:M20/M25/M40 family metallo-hydrolase n=1 Tax=Membranihabitans maritimus TaxID=2904244 RepID=UPI001F17FAFA|nr:M20/M25/M40 family metallo-hydrolase [Membranihabitans maritimus]